MASSNKAWLRDVGFGLLNAGLPITYVARSVSELHAHLQDRDEANDASDGGELGVSAQQLVSQFESSYRQSNWRCRVPYFGWLLLVLPLCIVVCLSYFGAIAIVMQSIGVVRQYPQLELPLAWAYYCGKLITPAIAFYVLAWCIRPLRMSGWGYAILAALLAAIFLVTVSRFRFPTNVHGGEMTLHLDDEEFAKSDLVWQAAQAAIVILLASADYIRQLVGRRRLREQLASEPAPAAIC